MRRISFQVEFNESPTDETIQIGLKELSGVGLAIPGAVRVIACIDDPVEEARKSWEKMADNMARIKKET